jgi:CheY-like chemotaxis protein
VSQDPAGSTEPPITGTIVYIEDDPVSVVLVQSLLDVLFPQVTMVPAASAEAGVRLVRQEKPDLVLLDMHLPGASGLDVLRQLNPEVSMQGLRVTLLTADAATPDVIKAMSLGAYEYWRKPLNLALFRSGLRRALTGAPPDRACRLPHLRNQRPVRDYLDEA